MSKENEPAKLLLPYLQRADELQKHEPLVAYYCRLYAMERGLKIPQSDRTKTTNSLLVSLMKQLEKDKMSVKLGPDDHLHLEGFALNVFAKADKQDRAGRADLNTAKTFYAASIFFEILNQFGELQPDIGQKQKYAAWKAADIRKALKEGRKPVPGPPGGESDISKLFTAQSGEYDVEPSRADPAIKPAPESDSSPRLYDYVQYTANTQSHSAPIPPAPPSHVPPSPPSYPTDYYPSNEDHSSHNFLQPPSNSRNESSSYSESYQHQPYPQEHQSHLPKHYPSQDIPSSCPNFQSYPSFTESSLPAAPSHHPSYYQESGASYSTSPPSTAANCPSNSQYNSSERNGPAKTYQYDSNYQPPPDKIAEAHKAARFAVGALAFDDVSIAVDYLKKSLELLTNPSAGQ